MFTIRAYNSQEHVVALVIVNSAEELTLMVNTLNRLAGVVRLVIRER